MKPIILFLLTLVAISNGACSVLNEVGELSFDRDSDTNGTGGTGGETGSTGGITGSTGGITGSTGGITGSTGGITGSTGGVTGSTGGVTGSTGGITGSTGGQTGGQAQIGEPCTKQTDCANYENRYCATNPLDSSEGYCTVIKCQVDEFCPQSFECCDCSGSPVNLLDRNSVCLKPEDVSQAEDMGGCICNNSELGAGFGEFCSEQNDCLKYDTAHFCFHAEGDTNGLCTTSYCDQTAAPDNFTCCDIQVNDSILTVMLPFYLAKEFSEAGLGTCEGVIDPDSGFGEVCYGDGDCSVYELATRCFQAYAPSPGFCTKEGCNESGCPINYSCCSCDIAGISRPETCLDDGTVSDFMADGLCSCEGGTGEVPSSTDVWVKAHLNCSDCDQNYPVVLYASDGTNLGIPTYRIEFGSTTFPMEELIEKAPSATSSDVWPWPSGWVTFMAVQEVPPNDGPPGPEDPTSDMISVDLMAGIINNIWLELSLPSECNLNQKWEFHSTMLEEGWEIQNDGSSTETWGWSDTNNTTGSSSQWGHWSISSFGDPSIVSSSLITPWIEWTICEEIYLAYSMDLTMWSGDDVSAMVRVETSDNSIWELKTYTDPMSTTEVFSITENIGSPQPFRIHFLYQSQNPTMVSQWSIDDVQIEGYSAATPM